MWSNGRRFSFGYTESVRLSEGALCTRCEHGEYLKLNLDVGCGAGKGANPRGDVNVDVKSGKLPNFIQASIYNLPFKDKTFDKCFCHHVLEHLDEPIRALTELRRVSRQSEIRVPYWICASGCNDHRSSFTCSWFKKVLSKHFILDLRVLRNFRYNHSELIGFFYYEIICRVQWR